VPVVNLSCVKQYKRHTKWKVRESRKMRAADFVYVHGRLSYRYSGHLCARWLLTACCVWRVRDCHTCRHR